jgi:hypothetical protein
MLPQVYLGLYYALCFFLELGGEWYDLRLPFAMYFSWFYLRFLMPNKTELGDSSDAFALFTFFPYSVRPQVAAFSYGIFTTINESTGVFDYIQRRFRSPLQNTNVVDRKKALEELDEEIKSLNSTSTTQPPPEMSFTSQP